LIDVVREMSIAAGLPMPKVYIIPDDMPNALATGPSPERASVAATRGLLKILNREELQGVMGHEMAHIRNLDILTMTVVSGLAAAIVIISGLARHSLWWGAGRRYRSRERRQQANGLLLLIIIAVAILGPIIAHILAMAVSRSREYLADATSAELTRNPGALASALKKIASYPKKSTLATEGTAHLFISDPFKRGLANRENFLAELFSTHPPIHKRIALLEEMAYRRVSV